MSPFNQAAQRAGLTASTSGPWSATRNGATEVSNGAAQMVPREPANGTQGTPSNKTPRPLKSNREQGEVHWIIDHPAKTPERQRPRPSLHALQEWEGYVVEIGEENFVAHLIDLTAKHTHETEEATIPLVEVSEHDASRMCLGSIFRWVIGYEISPAGTKKRVSQIVFRQLPRMTDRDIREARAWAKEMAQALNP